MSEYFQFLQKPDRVEGYLDQFLDRVEDRIPERAKTNPADASYQELALQVLREGKHVMDRTGTGTVKMFATRLQFDLSDNKFPLLTTKRIYTKSVFGELIWFIGGGTNIKQLNEMGIRIWNEWADENGDLGPVYGHQWRSWPAADGRSIDQLGKTISQIKGNPFSRRHIVSAWNVGELRNMALEPCHMLFQFDVEPNRQGEKDILNCQMRQRSADLFLGVPFNIASYAALTNMVAQVTDKVPGVLTIDLGDTHIYNNHFPQILTQLSRDPYPPPQLALNQEVKNIDDFGLEDIRVVKYRSHKKIPAPISV